MEPKLEANNTNSAVSIYIKTALVRNFYFCSTYFLYTFMIQTNLEALFEAFHKLKQTPLTWLCLCPQLHHN